MEKKVQLINGKLGIIFNNEDIINYGIVIGDIINLDDMLIQGGKDGKIENSYI